jgi:hypothetical protein
MDGKLANAVHLPYRARSKHASSNNTKTNTNTNTKSAADAIDSGYRVMPWEAGITLRLSGSVGLVGPLLMQ